MLARAASSLPKEGTTIDLRLAQDREGIKDMIVAVTRQTGLKTGAELNDPSVVWETLTAEKLEMDPKLSMDALFTAKDYSILTTVFRQYHEVGKEDIDDIVGKAVVVSVD